jgi:hypothetical protein
VWADLIAHTSRTQMFACEPTFSTEQQRGVYSIEAFAALLVSTNRYDRASADGTREDLVSRRDDH